MNTNISFSVFLILWISVLTESSSFKPVLPPSFPLAVRSPYLSAWLPAGTKNGGNLAGTWPQFWTTSNLGWAGMIRVDGKVYQFMGNPAESFGVDKLPSVTQTNASFTSTQTIFVAVAGPVTVATSFLSPITPNDLLRQSLPFSYVSINVSSNDAKSHSVQLYMDINGAWAVGNTSRNITWDFIEGKNNNDLYIVRPTSPVQFGEEAEHTLYGGAYFALKQAKGRSFQSGQSTLVRDQFLTKGVLTNRQDTSYRAANDRAPVVAFCADLGSIDKSTTLPEALFVIGHVRDPAIQYVIENKVVQHRSLYFFSKYPNPLDALAFFIDDYEEAFENAQGFDERIQRESAAISEDYGIITSLSVRQAFAGIEITVGKNNGGNNVYNTSDVYVFMKEISSDGNINTVDVIMPSHPIFLYLNPALVGRLLEPLLRYQQAKQYPNLWSMHDLGSHYPNATGHPNGKDEPMPIEESGNMIIMGLAHAEFSNDFSLLTKYYGLFKQWATYLVNTTLIPGFQLATTDAAGPLANQTNLAVKGIIALRCMVDIATKTSHNQDALYFKNVSASYLPKWISLSTSKDETHIKLAYQEDSSWGIQFNLFADRLLDLKFIPEHVYSTLDDWYIKTENAYGVQLDTRVKWGKTDWNMWCAAASNNAKTRDMFISSIVKYIQSGSSNGPFPDRYSTIDGTPIGVKARPTVGAHFALLLRK